MIQGRVLFPLAITPTALLEYNDSRDKLTHEVAAELVRDHGVLVLGPGDEHALLRGIRQLSGRPQVQWQEVIRALRMLHRLDEIGVSSLSAAVAGAQGGEGPADKIELAIVDDGVRSPTIASSAELVDLSEVRSSKTALRARQASAFPPGTGRDDVAAAFIRPSASRSRRVTVLDPHLFDDILEASRPQGVKVNGLLVDRYRDHVEWLIQTLAVCMGPDCTVHLIGEVPTQRRGDGQLLTRDFVRSEINRKIGAVLKAHSRSPTISITLVQAPAKGVKTSNRFLDFDCGVTVEVTHDVLRLGTATVPEPDDLTFRRLDASQSRRAIGLMAAYANYQSDTALNQWDVPIAK